MAKYGEELDKRNSKESENKLNPIKMARKLASVISGNQNEEILEFLSRQSGLTDAKSKLTSKLGQTKVNLTEKLLPKQFQNSESLKEKKEEIIDSVESIIQGSQTGLDKAQKDVANSISELEQQREKGELSAKKFSKLKSKLEEKLIKEQSKFEKLKNKYEDQIFKYKLELQGDDAVISKSSSETAHAEPVSLADNSTSSDTELSSGDVLESLNNIDSNTKSMEVKLDSFIDELNRLNRMSLLDKDTDNAKQTGSLNSNTLAEDGSSKLEVEDSEDNLLDLAPLALAGAAALVITGAVAAKNQITAMFSENSEATEKSRETGGEIGAASVAAIIGTKTVAKTLADKKLANATSKPAPKNMLSKIGNKLKGVTKTTVKTSLKAVPVVGTAIGALSVGSTLVDDALTGSEKGDIIAEEVGGMVGAGLGAAKGAAAGAIVGSIVPLIGTAIGGVVGGLAGGIMGYFAGSAIGDTAGDLIFGDHTKTKRNPDMALSNPESPDIDLNSIQKSVKNAVKPVNPGKMPHSRPPTRNKSNSSGVSSVNPVVIDDLGIVLINAGIS